MSLKGRDNVYVCHVPRRMLRALPRPRPPRTTRDGGAMSARDEYELTCFIGGPALEEPKPEPTEEEEILMSTDHLDLVREALRHTTHCIGLELDIGGPCACGVDAALSALSAHRREHEALRKERDGFERMRDAQAAGWAKCSELYGALKIRAERTESDLAKAVEDGRRAVAAAESEAASLREQVRGLQAELDARTETANQNAESGIRAAEEAARLREQVARLTKELDEARAAKQWQAEHTEVLEKNWERLVEIARRERDEARARVEELVRRIHRTHAVRDRRAEEPPCDYQACIDANALASRTLSSVSSTAHKFDANGVFLDE